MKRLLSALFALLLLPATACARTADGPALWAVKDADTTIYLFGTIHLLPPGTDWLKPGIARAFDSADRLVIEAEIPEDPAQLQPLMLSLGITPGLPPLKDRLDPAHAAKLEGLAREVGLPAVALDSFETWLVGLALTSAEVMKLGFDPAQGVERQLMARAKPAAKPIVGLETVEQQLRLFDTLPEADQRAMLVTTIDEAAEIKTKLGGMVASWLAGDADRIGAEMSEDLRASPRIAKLLLADRNARWADWIAQRLDQPGTVFVAVGAGHLAGADSVQAMLAKRGLKAERIPY